MQSYEDHPLKGEDESDNSLSGTVVLAIILVALITIALAIRTALHLRFKQYIFPRYGLLPSLDHIGTTRLHIYGPFAMALLSNILKIAAFGVNEWEYDFGLVGTVTIEYTFRLFGVTVRLPNNVSQTQSYKSVCDALAAASAPSAKLTVCHTLMASGIFTLVCGIISMVCIVLVAILTLRVIQSRQRLETSAIILYRASDLAYFFSMSSAMYWGAGSHIMIKDLWKVGIFSMSWFLLLAGAFIDFGLMIWYRRAFRVLPAPNGEIRLPADANGFAPLTPQQGEGEGEDVPGQPHAEYSPPQFHAGQQAQYHPSPSQPFVPYVGASHQIQ